MQLPPYYEKYLDRLKRHGWSLDRRIAALVQLENGNEERLEDYSGWLDIKLYRVLEHLDLDELEFLQDAFVDAGMIDALRPQIDDEECYDFADEIQDAFEIRKYGRTVTGRANQ